MARSREAEPTVSDLAKRLDDLTGKVTKKTEAQLMQEAILGELAKLGGQRVQEDAIVRQGTRLVLPATMEPTDAIEFIQEYVEQQETVTAFTRTFRYRPNDGAAALDRALRRVFGSAGIGKSTWSFFEGRKPPQRRTINTGAHETMQVPAGVLAVPSFQGRMSITASNHRELGPLFVLLVECPRKYEAHVEGLFQVIEEELKERSIYKGKAVDGQIEPEFLDLAGVDPNEVIYSDEVVAQLDANLWSVLRHTEVLRSLRIPRKRAVLLEGPYGTGKTLAAFVTAQIATANDWSFIYCRPATDDLGQVMGMARLYQPCIVFFEDVDTIAEGEQERDGITRLLDIFDGIQAKGTEIVAVLTTNHKERIHKAMVRPGRLDAMIHVGALDQHGCERMINAVVPNRLLSEELDFDAIYTAMEGYLPAFVKEAIDRAMRYAISRDNGNPETLVTSDFVRAAEGLRPQLELMEGAKEGSGPDTLTQALNRAVKTAMHEAPIVDNDGDQVFTLVTQNGS